MKKSQPEHLRQFAERVRELTDPLGSVAKAAKTLGIPENTLRRAREGENEPQAPLLLALSSKLNVSLSYLLGADDDQRTKLGGQKASLHTIAVPKLDVRAAAGGGAINNILKTEETREFPLWMLQTLTKTARGKPSSLGLIRAAGDSMEPLIRSGALLLVDNSARDPRHSPKPQNQWENTDVYIFLQGDELRVKRLRVDRKGFTIALSENQSYDPEILHKQEFKVLGRVIWWDNRL